MASVEITIQDNKATESFSVSLPGWLLESMDMVCEKRDFNRSSFIRRAVKKYILMQIDSPKLWNKIYQELREESC